METPLMMITTIVVALITAVIGPAVLEWVRAKLKKTEIEDKRSPIDEAIEVNTLVDEQLNVIIEELGCDRVWVAQFHNGGHFYPTGKSIQKFSIFYEKVVPGVLTIQHTFQNVPCSLFPKALAQLYKEGELSIPTYEGEDYDLAGVSAPYGTKSFYMVALDDLHGRFIGVISIAYNAEHKLSKEEWIFIRQKIGAIGNIMSNYLHNKK